MKKRIDFFEKNIVRTLAFVMAMVFAACFVACSSNTVNTNTTEGTSKPTEDAVITTAPTEDTVGETTGNPEETTGTPDVTPTDGNEVTTSPTEDTTTTPQETTPPVEETTAPIETTAPVTTQPVTDTTTAPIETTPPVDTQPIADPEQFPDDWGISYENNAFRTDRKEFLYWTKTRHLVEIPKNFPTNWVVEMIDEKNEQIFISVGELSEGTCVFYALVNGVFYKLSEEKIIKVTIHNKQFAWIEEDGTAYSINIRTKWFNEVYVEASDAAGICFRNNALTILNQDAEMIEKNQEDILREVKKVSN